MQDLNDLHYFARVVEAGGFAAAGRLLGIPKSRLSRRIAELEARLGVRLMQRTTRKLALTDVGERYYQHCQTLLQAAQAADEAVAAVSEVPRGRLRVSCPVSLAQTEFARILPGFLLAYPLVQLDMLLRNQRIDLLEEGVDVALRVRSADEEDSSVVVRKLWRASSILVAAPALLVGQSILTPDDLHAMPILGATEADKCVHWRLLSEQGEQKTLALAPRLAADDFVLRKAAAIKGLGVTMLPQMYCDDAIANGSLVRILPGWGFTGGYLQAAYPHRRGLLPAARAFIDYLVAHFATHYGPPI